MIDDRAARPSAAGAPLPLAPGDAIAPGYVVLEHMRRGHDTDTYDAWSEERTSRCVIKTLRPDRAGDRSARNRLLREGRLLQRLTHPHIVRGYETLTQPVAAIVLETLPGQTLAHLIETRRSPLPATDLAHLGLHLCSAVQYLHRHGVLHLDLKPSNVIASHGVAKLLDLSVARPPGRSRACIGTVGYMAPEQLDGGHLDAGTDVWGIGAVLFEAVTGNAPAPADAATDTGGMVQIDPAPVSLRRYRRLPTAFRTLVERCLGLDPAARPTLAELRVELESVV
ncbi:MAG: serine/threonine protein kinase [Thermomicrobiales bacterium]|nr:serine/threonine protein kinase [Thermomicrobiales bacterium]